MLHRSTATGNFDGHATVNVNRDLTMPGHNWQTEVFETSTITAPLQQLNHHGTHWRE